MNAETHSQLANFIWSICNLLRGPYKRNEYRKVILPLTVLRRFDCLLASTKAKVLEEYPKIKSKPENVVRSLLQKVSKRPFYNLSKLDFAKLAGYLRDIAWRRALRRSRHGARPSRKHPHSSHFGNFVVHFLSLVATEPQ